MLPPSGAGHSESRRTSLQRFSQLAGSAPSDPGLPGLSMRPALVTLTGARGAVVAHPLLVGRRSLAFAASRRAVHRHRWQLRGVHPTRRSTYVVYARRAASSPSSRLQRSRRGAGAPVILADSGRSVLSWDSSSRVPSSVCPAGVHSEVPRGTCRAVVPTTASRSVLVVRPPRRLPTTAGSGRVAARSGPGVRWVSPGRLVLGSSRIRLGDGPVPHQRVRTLRRLPLVGSRAASLRPLPPCRSSRRLPRRRPEGRHREEEVASLRAGGHEVRQQDTVVRAGSDTLSRASLRASFRDRSRPAPHRAFPPEAPPSGRVGSRFPRGRRPARGTPLRDPRAAPKSNPRPRRTPHAPRTRVPRGAWC
jgi:hypothetical protein